MPSIKLVSSDGVEFTVPVEVARFSSTIKTLFENRGTEEGEVVALSNVSGDILNKIIEWATYHKDDPAAMDKSDSDEIGEWDANFMKINQHELFGLSRAANYLDIKGLLDIACKTIANMIKGKNSEELKELFNLAD